MLDIEACMQKRMFQGVVLSLPLPLRHQAREPPQGLRIEAHCLAHFARSRLAAIGNHIGGDGGAQLAITLIDVLNRLLAFISGGQIEIDVRPFSAAFAQKAFKKQVHADRIDRGNFQRIADGGIRGTPPALHQDVVSLAEINQVPHDQKITGKAQLLNQGQLMLNLLFGSFQSVFDCVSTP